MKFTKLLAMLSIFLIFTGCSSEEKSSQPPLRIGSAMEFAPFDFQEEGSNQYQGFDIDLIRAVGRELNREVQISDIGFESGFDKLILTLDSNNIDAIIAGMTITEERKDKVLFSDPYYRSGLTIAVREDETGINKFADLAGKRVAVLIETTGGAEVQRLPNVTIQEFEYSPGCFEALANGEVDAVVQDRPVTDYMIARGEISNVKVLPELLTQEDYGIAVRKDDVELQQQINDALKKIRESGEYDRIFDRWFRKPKQ